MTLKITNLFLLGIIALISCNSENKKNDAPGLFSPTSFTPDSSFTSGAEGPAVDKNGNLYAVNYKKNGTIGIVTPEGKADVFIELSNGSIGNGIRFNSKGKMLIADYINHNILQVDMNDKSVITVFAHDSTMSQPNDIAIDSKDNLYASDPDWKAGTGRIWRIDTSGHFTLLESNMGTTNGIEVSPDEKKLYVNESVQRKVWVYDLGENGTITNKKLLIEFPDFGMDGMRCDAEGNLYITRHGKGTVVKVSPEGKILKEIVMAGKKPSNIAFGGKNGCTAFVTLQDKGNIESFVVDIPGREWKMMQ